MIQDNACLQQQSIDAMSMNHLLAGRPGKDREATVLALPSAAAKAAASRVGSAFIPLSSNSSASAVNFIAPKVLPLDLSE
jgi:hypothetical protein